MLDIRFIRENFDIVRTALQNRNSKFDLDAVVKLDDERKKILIVSGLIVVQLFLVSLQVPLGEQPSLMARAVFFVLAPAEHAVRGLTGAAAGVWNRYLYLRGVETQNQAMRDELFHLRQENIHLRQGLSRLLDREAAAALLAGLKRSFRMASVIGVDAVNVHKSVIVDLGRADGLVPTSPWSTATAGWSGG